MQLPQAGAAAAAAPAAPAALWPSTSLQAPLAPRHSQQLAQGLGGRGVAPAALGYPRGPASLSLPVGGAGGHHGSLHGIGKFGGSLALPPAASPSSQQLGLQLGQGHGQGQTQMASMIAPSYSQPSTVGVREWSVIERPGPEQSDPRSPGAGAMTLHGGVGMAKRPALSVSNLGSYTAQSPLASPALSCGHEVQGVRSGGSSQAAPRPALQRTTAQPPRGLTGSQQPQAFWRPMA